MGAHARVHVHFVKCGMLSDRCCEHHARAGVYVKQVLCTSAYTFAYTLATVQFVHLALGNEDGGGQLVYKGTCCLAWRVVFNTRRDRGVVCVFSTFKAGGSVCGCRCVYTRTLTNTAHMGYSDVSPRAEMVYIFFQWFKVKPDRFDSSGLR